ncbi:MAG: beta-propeller domain-containing protein [Methanoregulaceae archaeon]|nr:beta-propeller domain-containing protein [Methanoregulaceae archaeon]
MSQKKLILIVTAVLVLIAILISGCLNTPVMTSGAPGLKKFNSTAEIEQYIRESAETDQQEGYYRTIPMTMVPTIGGMGTSWAPASKSQESAADGMAIPAPAIIGSGDYSQTNIQVAGVDEPDIVKNDARYIYTISGSTLTIVDAYPAETARVISKTEIADTPQDLFIAGDRLVLFTVEWGSPDNTADNPVESIAQGVEKMMPMPPLRINSPTTHAVIYDIRDRTKPVVLKDYSMNGDYLDARMIGSTVYMVTRDQVYPYSQDQIIVPTLREGSRTVVQPDVWYFDNREAAYTFTTITALDAAGGNEKDAQTYLLGSGNILYVSPDAIYVSYQRYHPYVYPVRGGIDGSLPQPATANRGTGTGSISSSPVPADFNTLTEDQRQAIISGLRSEEQEAIRQQEADQTSTVIHKIAIADGRITYAAKGEVAGVLDNQFSMDEYADNLRVATTSSVSTRSGSYTYNNVYVLDGKMDTIGSLTHIAEQETIYSTRFLGERLYMVTFKRIDPFFVIDLSNPENPKILGKLKIPGYSDYLHPYDATHIIGIGKETTTNEWGGVSTSGVKLALFDVSDVASPKQLDKVQIGDAGSDSAALTDHHAFLFDKAKNLLVIPVRAVSTQQVTKGDYYNNQPQTWYGAYVFGLTPETGFDLKGTVQHGSGDNGYYYYGSSASDVKRSLYIGDVLYTMSPKQIKANSLADINTTIATIPLPGFDDIYYPVMKGGME